MLVVINVFVRMMVFANQRGDTAASLITLQEWWQCRSGGSAGAAAADVSGSFEQQLTAALTGKNYHHAALLRIPQATVPAPRNEHYANMVSVYAALRLRVGQLVSIARLERTYCIPVLVADLCLAIGFLDSFSCSVAF
jgi:hypothetical protein